MLGDRLGVCEGDRVTPARREGDTEGLAELLALRHALAVGLSLPETLPLGVSEWDPVALPERELQGVGVCDSEVVPEGDRVPLGEPLRERETEGEGLTDAEGDASGEEVGERLTATEPVAVREPRTLDDTDALGESLTLPVKDVVSVDERDGERDTVALGVSNGPDPLAQSVPDTVGVTEMEADTLLEREGVLVTEAQPLGLPEVVTVLLALTVAPPPRPPRAPVGDTDSVADTDAEVHCEGVVDTEEDTLVLAVRERVKEGLPVPLCVLVGVMEEVGQRLTVPLREWEDDTEGEGLTVGQLLGDAEREALSEAVVVTEPQPLREALALAHAEPLLETPGVSDGATVPLSDVEPERVGEIEALGDADAEADTLGDAEALGEPDTEPVPLPLPLREWAEEPLPELLCAPDAVPAAEAVSASSEGEADPEAVPLSVGSGVCDALKHAVAQKVGEEEPLREGDTEGVGECDPDTVCEGVWHPLPLPLATADGEARNEEDALPLPLPHSVGLPVMEGEIVALGELEGAAVLLLTPLPLRDTLGEALGVAAAVALTEREGEALELSEAVGEWEGVGDAEREAEMQALCESEAAEEGECKGVPLCESEPLPLEPALALAPPLGDRGAVPEALPHALREGVTLSEKDADADRLPDGVPELEARLRDALGEGNPAGEALVVGVTEKESPTVAEREGVTVALWDGDSEAEGQKVPVGEPEAVPHEVGDPEKVPLPVKEVVTVAECEGHPEAEREAQEVGLEDAENVAVAAPERLCEALAVPHSEGVLDGVALREGVAHEECEGEAVLEVDSRGVGVIEALREPQGVAVADAHVVCVLEGEMVLLPLAVKVAVEEAHREGVVDALGVCVVDAVTVEEPLMDWEGDTLLLPLTVVLADRERLGVEDPVTVEDAEAQWLGVVLPENEGVTVAEALAVLEEEKQLVAEAVGDAVAQALADVHVVPLAVMVELADRHTLAVEEGLAERVTVEEPDTVALAVAVPVTEAVVLPVALPVAVEVAVALPLAVALAVRLTVAVEDTLAVEDAVEVEEAVAEAVLEAVAVAVEVADVEEVLEEVAVAVALPVADALPDSVAVADVDAVELPVELLVAVEDAEAVAVREAVAEDVAVREDVVVEVAVALLDTAPRELSTST